MKRICIILGMLVALMPAIVNAGWGNDTEATKEAQKVTQQQAQYAKAQPIPFFNWSLERHLVIELYKLRNQKVITHSVWRGDMSVVEGDCPSMGYGLPYDLSLTNPLIATAEDGNYGWNKQALATIEQAEPNGLFASKNTNATWVMCIGPAGDLEPIYIEAKVTVYPGPVEVDYSTNRVKRVGKASVTISNK
ncbi:hypothetical protein JZU46_00930 [bacterium]|nr:hypothetical protein [bacterium]